MYPVNFLFAHNINSNRIQCIRDFWRGEPRKIF